MPSQPLATLRYVTDSARPSIVIVEDDRSVRDMLESVLTHSEYDVTSFADGAKVVDDPATRLADLVVLDVGLPDISGFDVCRRLRQAGYRRGILMLTARHEVQDRVEGLDAGADDYLVKPFALDELLARVRANVRRFANASPPVADDQPTLTLADLTIDRATFTAQRSGTNLELTKIEFTLLELLVANSPRVLTREVLYERIWGLDAASNSNSLEVFVSQVRKKTEAAGGSRVVQTVRGVGYVARLNE